NFIRAAAAGLSKGGRLWLVANQHLPYENIMRESLRHMECLATGSGFKVLSGGK
ncbi:MAG: methyltransferase, partial [Alphaproteobacteria bacterium]|nr:methyltransferase [Alphaproteobacteria bacterium]